MDRLVKKIEELNRLLKAFNMKAKTDVFVPALKLPNLGSISAVSSFPKPTKIPGIGPSSKKDPAKIAAQLKNPNPSKAKIEILKTDKNGQWSLE